MKLTELEIAIMKAGNPPDLDSPVKGSWQDYSEEDREAFIAEYKRRRWGYRRLAIELGWDPKAARNLLERRGALRKRQTIPESDYVLLRKLIDEGLKTPQIAQRTGWTTKRVKSLRENMRKNTYRTGHGYSALRL